MTVEDTRAACVRTFALVLASWVVAGGSDAAERTISEVTLPAVALRRGVTADIHYTIYAKGDASCTGKVILAVHGVAHAAASWQPLAEKLLDEVEANVCKVVAVDLPGHGFSGLPTGGVRFGNLRLSDYVSVVRASLEGLPQLGLQPDTLLAHSQGGLVVQLTQKALLSHRSSLRRLGVTSVVLLASVPPRQVPWAYVDGGSANPTLARFITFDRTLGLHISVPDAAWASLFFADLTGTIVGAPDLADVARYNAPEPSITSVQLVGLGVPRPSVPSGVFSPAHGTGLTVVTMESDTIIRPGESTLLYEHLTGMPPGFSVVVVPGAAAVHDMHVADPDALVEVLTAAGGG